MLGHGDLIKTGIICRYHETTITKYVNIALSHFIHAVHEIQNCIHSIKHFKQQYCKKCITDLRVRCVQANWSSIPSRHSLQYCKHDNFTLFFINSNNPNFWMKL